MKRLLALLLIAPALSAGCKSKLAVRQIPTFWDESIRTVGVFELRNRSLDERAGGYVTAEIVEALRANGSYKVLGPAQLERRLKEAGAAPAADVGDEELLAAARKVRGLDALLVGSVHTFAAGAVDDSPRFRTRITVGWGFGVGHGYFRHRHHDPFRHWGDHDAWAPYSQARVTARVRLLRVRDGKVLYATAEPLSRKVASYDSPVDLPAEVLAEATRRLAGEVVERVAIVEKELKLKPGSVLKTFEIEDDGERDETSGFDADDPVMIVRIQLPPEADRNEFTLTVRRSDAFVPAETRRFTWSAARGVLEMRFDPSAIVAHSGKGRYEIELSGTGAGGIVRKISIR